MPGVGDQISVSSSCLLYYVNSSSLIASCSLNDLNWFVKIEQYKHFDSVAGSFKRTLIDEAEF